MNLTEHGHQQRSGTVHRAQIATALAAVVAAAMLPAGAGASIGTGVSASPIVLATPAHTGRSYALPGFYVVNTGTVRSRYQVRVQRLSAGSERTLPPGWVTLGRDGFLLAPHRGAIVPVRITIPSGAPAGDYLTDLVASTSTARRAGASALGAAAATKLQLQIRTSGSGLPWGTVGLVALALVALAAGAYGMRRLPLRLRVERRG